MNYIKFLVTLFVLALLAIACDDKVPAEPATCDPACENGLECVVENGKAECREAAEPTKLCDPACNEGEECVCAAAENGTECKCETKAEEPIEPVCDPVCGEDEECRCADEGCKCEKKAEEPVVELKCEPACNAETEDCVCTEDKCECRAKDAPVEECFCDEAKAVKCPEGGKEACQSEEPPAEEAKCEPACEDNKECKCEADKCECVDKAAEEPSEQECNEEKPCADENKECKENKCVDKAPAEEKPEE